MTTFSAIKLTKFKNSKAEINDKPDIATNYNHVEAQNSHPLREKIEEKINQKLTDNINIQRNITAIEKSFLDKGLRVEALFDKDIQNIKDHEYQIIRNQINHAQQNLENNIKEDKRNFVKKIMKARKQALKSELQTYRNFTIAINNYKKFQKKNLRETIENHLDNKLQEAKTSFRNIANEVKNSLEPIRQNEIQNREEEMKEPIKERNDKKFLEGNPDEDEVEDFKKENEDDAKNDTMDFYEANDSNNSDEENPSGTEEKEQKKNLRKA